MLYILLTSAGVPVLPSQAAWNCEWVKSKPGWEQYPSHLPQAVDIISQASFSAGFIGHVADWADGLLCTGSHSKEMSFHQYIPCSGEFNILLKCGRQSSILPKLSRSCRPGKVPYLVYSPHRRTRQAKPREGYGTYHTPLANYVSGRSNHPTAMA